MHEDEAAAAARRELEQRGFAVLTSPRLPNIAMPDWLQPDLVSVQEGQVVLVELKSAHASLPLDHLTRAREFAAAHGWEFLMWQFDPFEVEVPPQEPRARRPQEEP